jgi:hypothetical protein
MCISIPPHYMADPAPTAEKNIIIDWTHDDLTNNPQVPDKEITRNNPTEFCGRAYTRGIAKESRYWVRYHVEAFIVAH